MFMVRFARSSNRREKHMTESDLELKMRIAEELEFELIMATKSGNADFALGIERALSIVEEMT
jgi:hypothetical protein